MAYQKNLQNVKILQQTLLLLCFNGKLGFKESEDIVSS
jgi:hypothetical protein